MTAHVYHEALEGFHPDQILHDGCPECERRGADVEIALANMDVQTFHRAAARGLLLERGKAEHVSHAEVTVLRVLGSVQLRLANDKIFELLTYDPKVNYGAKLQEAGIPITVTDTGFRLG